MKRLALALAVVSIVACKKGEEAQPAADTTAAAPAAPAPAADTMKMADTTKAMPAPTTKAPTTTKAETKKTN